MPVLTLFLLLVIGFAAGFIDSIVGGGGLISTPGLVNLFPDFPILKIIGTQRTSSIFGTSVAARNYFRIVPFEKNIVLPACGGALVASFLGVQLAKSLPTDILRMVILVLVVVLAIYTAFKKELGQVENRRFSPEKIGFASAAVGTVCGFYNGLIGPGTGTMLVFGFVQFIGLDFLKSSAVSKAANVAGDLSSWAVLFASGFIVWKIAIPLVVANVAGSFAGSRLAILRGSRFIRWVFLAVVFGLVGRLLFDFL